MAITLQLLRTPPPVGFTGNALTTSIAVLPYRQQDESRQLRFVITVELESIWLSGTYGEIYRTIILPDTQGMVHFDVSQYLDAHLQYFIPDYRMQTIQECQRQSMRYRVGYSLNDNNGVVVATTFTSAFVAVKGGYERTYQPGNKVLTDTDVLLTTELVRSGNPLYNRTNPSIRYVPHELRYMYYLCRATATPAEPDRPAIDVVCANDADNETYIFPDQEYRQWRVYCIPLTLPTLFDPVPPNPISFNLRMAGLDTENIAFTIDTRTWYDTRTLLYRNSMGGIGTITLRGEIEFENDIERTSYAQVAWPNAYENGILRALNAQSRATETQRTKGVTGFISRAALDGLRDMLLTDELYEYIPAYGLIPAIINTNKVKLYSNNDNLYALELEWERATAGKFISPLPYPAVICPALTLFVARQLSRYNLEIIWSIPEPYYTIQVEVIIDGETTSYTYSGVTGRWIQAFENPLLAEPSNITVRGRVVCNPYSSPMETSAWTTLTVEIVANLAPIAEDDVISIPAGYNTPIELSVNALDNDYDPDGDAIECVVLTEAATAQGGELSLAADGTITYLPPSSVFVGEDNITYTLREVAPPNLSDTALIRIMVIGETTGGGTVIYLRIVPLDVTTTTTSTVNRTQGKRYVYFYSDAAGTIALDLTGMGISFEVTKTEVETTYREAEEPDISTVITATTYTPVGIRQFIHDGVFNDYRYAAGELTRSTIITHAITPDAAFVILP